MQQELLKTVAAAVVLALHVFGGVAPFVPNSTITATVCILQFVSLLQAAILAHAQRVVKAAAEGAKQQKVADLSEPGDAVCSLLAFARLRVLVAGASAVAWDRACAALLGPAVRWAAGALAVLTAARLLRFFGAAQAPGLLMLAGLICGAAARAALGAGSAETCGARGEPCCCGSQVCDRSASCPYCPDFWADMLSPQLEPEEED
mmetsp:Transcript_7159/g.22375  ORF Transcript_7159/g.22375 Transcript_7159/m.22375 type:complete len:205 (+) Transcript_7159:1-615(+)